jgi:hypothetical protein
MFPTAVQAVADGHDTEYRLPSSVVGGWIDHSFPFQRAITGGVNRAPEPTAVHAFADEQDTETNREFSRGVWMRWIDQRTPFQRSTSGDSRRRAFT